MKKKIALIIVLCLCFVGLIVGGTIGLVGCDKEKPSYDDDKNWTDNY